MHTLSPHAPVDKPHLCKSQLSLGSGAQIFLDASLFGYKWRLRKSDERKTKDVRFTGCQVVFNSDFFFFSLLSVSVLIFNTTSHCFVLVKQFRPGEFPPFPPRSRSASCGEPQWYRRTNTPRTSTLFIFLLSQCYIWIVIYPVATFNKKKKAVYYNSCLFNWILVTMHK